MYRNSIAVAGIAEAVFQRIVQPVIQVGTQRGRISDAASRGSRIVVILAEEIAADRGTRTEKRSKYYFIFPRQRVFPCVF